MQIVVQDLLTHYEKRGKGPVLLLLHGWGDRLETFRSLSEDLSKNYQLLSLDLPGFGQTDPPKAAWNLSNYAKFVHDFLEKLEVNKVYGVIGHSNGGALAIHAVANGQLDPEKLILLAPSGVRNTAGVRRSGLKIVAKAGKAATFWLPEQTRRKLQKKLYGTVGSDMLVAPHLKETFKQTVRQDIQADAARLKVPALLIYGEHDTATPLEEVGMILHDQIRDSQLVVMHDADHFVHKRQPERVLQTIKEFLKS